MFPANAGIGMVVIFRIFGTVVKNGILPRELRAWPPRPLSHRQSQSVTDGDAHPRRFPRAAVSGLRVDAVVTATKRGCGGSVHIIGSVDPSRSPTTMGMAYAGATECVGTESGRGTLTRN